MRRSRNNARNGHGRQFSTTSEAENFRTYQEFCRVPIVTAAMIEAVNQPAKQWAEALGLDEEAATKLQNKAKSLLGGEICTDQATTALALITHQVVNGKEVIKQLGEPQGINQLAETTNIPPDRLVRLAQVVQPNKTEFYPEKTGAQAGFVPGQQKARTANA